MRRFHTRRFRGVRGEAAFMKGNQFIFHDTVSITWLQQSQTSANIVESFLILNQENYAMGRLLFSIWTV